MTEFVFGPYRLEVDVEATRAYYAAHNEPWVTCTCAGCRNFVRAVKTPAPAGERLLCPAGPGPGKGE